MGKRFVPNDFVGHALIGDLYFHLADNCRLLFMAYGFDIPSHLYSKRSWQLLLTGYEIDEPDALQALKNQKHWEFRVTANSETGHLQ